MVGMEVSNHFCVLYKMDVWKQRSEMVEMKWVVEPVPPDQNGTEKMEYYL